MTLQIERRFVFEMLVNGKIDICEAEGLMDAMDDSSMPKDYQKIKLELDAEFVQALSAKFDEPAAIKNFK